MVDKKMNNNESDLPLEQSLGRIKPKPIATSSGVVMYESGRTVGQQEARAHLQRRSNLMTIGWQLATVASLTLALLSITGAFGGGDSQPEPVADSQQDFVDLPHGELSDNGSKPNQIAPEIYAPREVRRDQKQTLVSIRDRLLNEALISGRSVAPAITGSFHYQPAKTNSELMNQFKNSGAL